MIVKLRGMTINIEICPSIQGVTGYDEWSIEDMKNSDIDRFLNDLDKLVKEYKGKYTGTCT